MDNNNTAAPGGQQMPPQYQNQYQYQYQNPYNNYYTPSPRPEYTSCHSVFAWLALVLGFIFIKTTLFLDTGLLTTVFILLFTVLSIIYMAKNGVRFTFGAVAMPLILLIFAPVFLLSDNFLIRTLTLLFEMFCAVYWYLIAFYGTGFLSESLILDGFRASILPFFSYGNIFGAMFRPMKKTKGGKKVLYILLGCVITVIPTTVVMALLINADKAFFNLTRNLFSGIFDQFWTNFWILVLAIPVMMYIFGMMYTASKRRGESFLNKDQQKSFFEKAGITPTLIVCTVMIPLGIVYLLFFVSQLGYYFSAFSGLVPEGFSVAGYAREGFFELFKVSLINAVVIALARLLVRKNGKGNVPVPVRILTVILSLSELLLIATALRKMVLYMEIFGLTLLRFYTSWFMVLLALCFVVLLIRQIAVRLPFTKICAVIFTVLFALLVYCDVDAVIAKTNISLYENGTLDTVDVEMFYELSESAVPYVLPLCDSENEEISSAAEDYRRTCKDSVDTPDCLDDWLEFNIPHMKAVRALGK